jgi:tripartite-type tricarboxylate transporter receptor subunit TctC
MHCRNKLRDHRAQDRSSRFDDRNSSLQLASNRLSLHHIDRGNACGNFHDPFLTLVVFALAVSALPATAQSWPARPVRLIVPFAPGGSSDIAARVFAQRLSERLGQQIVVDNRSSAGGVVGAELLARASADGYTLGLSNVSSQTASPLIFSGVNYHPVTSFTHIAFIGTVPVVFMVHPNFPARTVAEFVRLAKESPGKFDYGSAGNGTVGHVVAEMFKLMAGVNLNHVPYRGSAFMFVDLRSNAIPSAFDALAQNTENIKAGLVRALAVSAPTRVRWRRTYRRSWSSAIPI